MALDIKVGPLLDPERWDRFVREKRGTNIFQETAWLRLLESIETFKPFHIILTRGGNIVGVFPNFKRLRGRIIYETESLPMGYGGPVWGGHSEEIFKVIFEVMEKEDDSVRHTVRIYGPEAAGLSGVLSEWKFKPVITDCLPVIDLSSGLQGALQRATAANRRDLKRAEACDVEVSESPLMDGDVEGFYSLYCTTTRALNSPSTLALRFFETLARVYGMNTCLVAAYAHGEMIAARLHLIDSLRSRIHYLYGGSSQEGKRRLAGTLLHKHSLAWAERHAYRAYDMGSTLADNRNSLYRYKINWGAEADIVPHWVKIRRPILFTTLKLLKPCIQNLRGFQDKLVQSPRRGINTDKG